MSMRWNTSRARKHPAGGGTHGFTIVELLIVIIVIGILATLVLVAYSNVTKQAANSAIEASVLNDAKTLAAFSETNHIPTLADVQSPSVIQISFPGNNSTMLASYCYTDSTFVVAAVSSGGKTFYAQRNGPAVNNDSLNVTNPCSALGLTNSDGTAATATFLGVSPSACASENGTCTFSGTKTVIYGATPYFNYKTGLTGSVTCNNTTFGDPYVGTPKYCYVASY